MPKSARLSWSHTVDSGLRLAFAVPITASLAADLPQVGRVVNRLAWPGHVGLALIIAVMALILLSLILRRERPERTMALVAMLTAGQVLMIADVEPGGDYMTWWPLGAVLSLVCYMAVWTEPHVRIQWTTAAVALLAAVRTWQVIVTRAAVVDGIVDAVLLIQIAVAASIIADQLQATAATADAAVRARRGARHQRAAAVTYQNQVREVERFLHDEVVHALRAVAMDRSRIPAAEAQRICEEAWAKLAHNSTESHGPTHDLLSTLETTAATSGLAVPLTGSAPALPPDVVDAMAGAVGEALHNVQRHSGVYEAKVTVTKEGRGVHVQISDDGQGFDPNTVVRRGLVTSVEERLQEVGGHADLESSPGKGTRVNLHWQPQDVRQAPNWTARSRLSLAAVPPLVGNLVVAGILTFHVSAPLLILLATVIVTLAGVSATRTLFSGPLSRARSVGLILASIVVVIINVWALDPSDTHGLHLFLVNGVTPLVFLVIISQPFAVGLTAVALVASTGFVSAMIHFGVAATWQYFTLVLLVPSGWLGVIAMQVMIDLLGKRAEDAREAAARSDSHSYHMAARAEISEQRLARIREELGPFLKAVGSGLVDSADPEVRRDAAVLESLVRDDIRFGGGSPELRRQLTQLRRQGWEVEVRLTPGTARRLDPELFTMVAGLADAGPDSSIIVTSLNDRITAVVQSDKHILDSIADLWTARGGEAQISPGFVRLTGP